MLFHEAQAQVYKSERLRVGCGTDGDTAKKKPMPEPEHEHGHAHAQAEHMWSRLTREHIWSDSGGCAATARDHTRCRLSTATYKFGRRVGYTGKDE